MNVDKQQKNHQISTCFSDNKSKNHIYSLRIYDSELMKFFMEKRIIPKNRIFVNEILKTFGLNHNDTQEIIDVCKVLSLNDIYWILPEQFDGKFAQYNLYENRFSEMLALVAYTSVDQSTEVFSTSPELTTNGMLPKAWRFIQNDDIYLYKGGTGDFQQRTEVVLRILRFSDSADYGTECRAV